MDMLADITDKVINNTLNLLSLPLHPIDGRGCFLLQMANAKESASSSSLNSLVLHKI